VVVVEVVVVEAELSLTVRAVEEGTGSVRYVGSDRLTRSRRLALLATTAASLLKAAVAMSFGVESGTRKTRR
jgi:hypothetical protein